MFKTNQFGLLLIFCKFFFSYKPNVSQDFDYSTTNLPNFSPLPKVPSEEYNVNEAFELDYK